MKKQNPFKYFKTSPEIIKLAVMYYVRFPLSLRNVEDILAMKLLDIGGINLALYSPKKFERNIHHVPTLTGVGT